MVSWASVVVPMVSERTTAEHMAALFGSEESRMTVVTCVLDG